MKKRILCAALALALAASLTGCLDDGGYGAEPKSFELTEQEPTEWAIYWYLCGSDLESGGGYATTDLTEMMKAALPDNVRVVIETGGSSYWYNDTVSADYIQRWVYDSQGLYQVDEQPVANMGSADTLADFLGFAKQYFPAEKTAVIFWNHGGGSVSGAAFDELYDYDSLELDELYEAFNRTWEPSAEKPPVELVGFDTCLMATLDVAWVFEDMGHYLVASEEVEPGCGWSYDRWLGALAEDPSMDGAGLGRSICDGFYEGCRDEGSEDSITLSVTDLTRLQPLLDAYDAFGGEALKSVYEDEGFYSRFARAASGAENYGGNTREQGYSNMVDLGDLARESGGILSQTSGDVLSALDECVIYTVSGRYRADSTGLSCYYSYSGDLDDYYGYSDVGAGEAFKYFYGYGLTGSLSDEGLRYISGLTEQQESQPPAPLTLTGLGWEDHPITVDEDGCATLTLGREANDVLATIGFSLCYLSEEDDLLIYLGTDNDMDADWERGVFKDNFRGVWGSLDGSLVYMELSAEGEDYNLYSVPVLLNGERYNLEVAYDFTLEQWTIQGARKPIENGMADKQLRKLEEGDQVTILWYASTISGDEEEFDEYEMDTVTVTADTAFYESDLGDGVFMLIFEMTDGQGNTAYSDPSMFEVADGEIYTYA